MAGVLDHFQTLVPVWDGLSTRMMEPEEAQVCERNGTGQITTNLQAKDLKTAAEFNEIREAKKSAMPPGMEPKKKKRTYKTREMKAEK